MKKLESTLDYFKDRYLTSMVILAIDCFVSAFASLLVVFILKYGISARLVNFGYALLWIVTGSVASAVGFYLLKTYRVIIRHMDLRDILVFVGAVVVKFVAQVVVAIFFFEGISHYLVLTVGLFDLLLTFGFLIFTRVMMIVVYDWFRNSSHKSGKLNVLICGTGDKSVALIPRLQNSPHYNVVGLMKSKKSYSPHRLLGKKIYYYCGPESVRYFKHNCRVDAIIVSSESDLAKYGDKIIEDSLLAGIKVLFAPSIDETTNGVVKHNHIREVKIEDLLGREEIKISMETITDYFKDKTVMVTGAAGSIGSELCRQLAGFGIRKLILLDNAETPMHYLRLELEDRFPNLDFVPFIGDVRIKERVDFAFQNYQPQVVFHAAAYKHVPLMEENPCEAIRVNVHGSKIVADNCVEYGVERMVMISTDKAVNPTNIMGCSKRLAEIYVQSLANSDRKGNTKFVTTRFGNVLGSNGSVIPRFREQIAKGGPVTVTHPDITRFFMTIPEACRLVMEAATLSDGNQIFVFDMGESVKIDSLARKMITLAGFEPDKDIKISYTGLRPGEKLYEEVLSNKENTVPTKHERIRIANVREYNLTDVESSIVELVNLATKVDIDPMVCLMKKIVPEYKSKNSRFCAFDKE